MTTPFKKEEPHKEKDADTQQIVQDAYDELEQPRLNPLTEQQKKSIILSSIEQATEPLQKQLANVARINTQTNANLAEVIQSRTAQPQPHHRGEWKFSQEPKLVPDSQPQRSAPRGQQQEWTVTPIYSKHLDYANVIISCVLDIGISEHRFNDDGGSVYAALKAATDAHNAELAAEMGKRLELCAQAVKDVDALNASHDALEQQLAAERQHYNEAVQRFESAAADSYEYAKQLIAERQRREQEVYETLPSKDCPTGIRWSDIAKWNELACEENQKLLLSALSAIEKHNKKFEGWSLEARIDCEFKKIDIDLSALHEHDAKVREPLVEALGALVKECKAQDILLGPLIGDAEDALAKIKEQ